MASKETGQNNDKDVPDVIVWGQFWTRVKFSQLRTLEYFRQLQKKNTKFTKCFPHERNRQYGTVKECMVARHLPHLDFHIKCGLKYKGTVKVDIRNPG